MKEVRKSYAAQSTHNFANKGKFSKAPSRIALNEFPDKSLKKERKKTYKRKYNQP